MATKEEPKSFTEFLGQLGHGDAEKQFSEAMQSLARKCMSQAEFANIISKGQLTIKIKLAVTPKGDVTISYDFVTKEPGPICPTSTFFLTKDGNLTRTPTRQLDLYDGDDGVVELDGRRARRN